MSTSMDENTVSANFVTFVNCLSLSERKVITMFLFCNKEFYKCNEEGSYDWNEASVLKNEEIIYKAKNVKWEISYHTEAFDRCEPDITIFADNEKFFIEVKTKNGTGFTDTEMAGGDREKFIAPEKHAYLVPKGYDYSTKIKKSPVCLWTQMNEFMIEQEIECLKFFKEVGKYIENFIQYNNRFTKGDIFMAYEQKYVFEAIHFLKKMNDLVEKSDPIIIQKLNEKIGNMFSSNPCFGTAKTCRWINVNREICLGYGWDEYVYDETKDEEENMKYAFSIWVDTKKLKIKENLKYDCVKKDNLIFFPLDKEVLYSNYEDGEVSNFIDAVVNTIAEVVTFN